MLKETVSYIDFNNVPRTEDLFFNLTKTEMSDMLDLQPRLANWAKETSGDPRDLSMAEIKELLDIIKLLIGKAYGIKTEDGRHFRKSAEAWEDFKDSAVYDAFVYGLFEDPLKAVGFMNGILPADIVARVDARQVQDTSLPAQPIIDHPPVPTSVDQGEVYTAVEEEIPAWMRENRDPTVAEFKTMTDEQKMKAFQAKSQR